MTGTSILEFKATGQIFSTASGPLEALRDVSFYVEENEFVAILGPSGCGKSTLLRLVAGLLKPTSGKVCIHDEAVAGPRDDIGIVFQKPTLLPWLSVHQNVVFPIKHTKGKVSAEHNRLADELLEMVGLEDFKTRMPRELSGGMQQRVAIARALLFDPEFLLMDEPFSALDALTREEMGFELLRIWQTRGSTVLFITHSISEAILLADRILVMSNRPGQIIADIKVPLPRPRSPGSMSDPVVSELAARLREMLIHTPSAKVSRDAKA